MPRVDTLANPETARQMHALNAHWFWRNTMVTQAIERENWADFFDSFSRAHDEWLVTIEVLDRELGDQIEVDSLPFGGTTLNGDGSLEIIAIAKDRHVSHTLAAPQRVFLKQSTLGADEVVKIESDDGNTLVHIRSPMLPAQVDGE